MSWSWRRFWADRAALDLSARMPGILTLHDDRVLEGEPFRALNC
jgi:hypothetical protein